MEAKNREKLLLMGVGLCVAFWLLNMVVFSPLTDSWHSRSDEIDRLQKEIADGARLVQRGSTIRQRWDFMRANALNSNPNVAERQLVTAFDRWARSGGVTQGSFRPQVQESDTNFLTVDCRSDVSGGLNNVRDFLRAMSQDPLADKLDSFVLTAKDDNGKQLTLDLNQSGLVLTDSVASLPPSTADLPPAVKETNSSTSPELDPFQLIGRNNIFDQSRIARDISETRPPVRPPRMETFTLCGLTVDTDKAQGVAFFEGSGVRSAHEYKVGETLNGFKITKITLDDVTLTNSSSTNSSSNSLVITAMTSLRREENGPWRPAGYIATEPAPATNSTTSVTSVSAPAAGSNSILEMLKKRREQEEK